jgi:hypothetical protein
MEMIQIRPIPPRVTMVALKDAVTPMFDDRRNQVSFVADLPHILDIYTRCLAIFQDVYGETSY